ncbi:Fic family protein [Microbacteriaceae bacterium VKM Ac-2854]|nr:Fic family protein [Microbacteriaceae bacterium VKM Ac-2854]
MADEGTYNDTPVGPDDAVAFLPGVEFETLAELYAAEAQELNDLRSQLYDAIEAGELTAIDITSRYNLEKMHELANGAIWTWAGRFRTAGLNIGSPPEFIREHLYGALDGFAWQTENIETIGLSPERLAMTAHHQLVRIHPFVDGNGRITRLFADVLLLALTGDRVFDWIEGTAYFDALRRADFTMDVSELLTIVGVQIFRD